MQDVEVKPKLRGFLDKLSRSAQSALALDYDGTLAPFRIDRFQAFPYPGVGERIRAIGASGRTRVVLISGRRAEEVRDLLGIVPPPEIWGQHGGQRLYPDGRSELVAMKDADRATLDEAKRWLRAEGLEHLAELKPQGIAVHWRGLSAKNAAGIGVRVQEAFAPLAERSGLSLLEFDGGLELRPREPNKGTAVATVRRELPPATPLAFLGDDATDEDAFRELHGTGAMTVLVRSHWRETAAEVWLRPPDELLAFLDAWLERTGGAQ
jgi:trehalose 6-phosphate phosphatase